MQNLFSHQTYELMRLAFDVYDFNQNDQICELDIVSLIKTQSLENLDRNYLKDLNLIISAINEKKKRKGFENHDIETALNAIFIRAGVQSETRDLKLSS
jgi:hypothetical protein